MREVFFPKGFWTSEVQSTNDDKVSISLAALSFLRSYPLASEEMLASLGIIEICWVKIIQHVVQS